MTEVKTHQQEQPSTENPLHNLPTYLHRLHVSAQQQTTDFIAHVQTLSESREQDLSQAAREFARSLTSVQLETSQEFLQETWKPLTQWIFDNEFLPAFKDVTDSEGKFINADRLADRGHQAYFFGQGFGEFINATPAEKDYKRHQFTSIFDSERMSTPSATISNEFLNLLRDNFPSRIVTTLLREYAYNQYHQAMEHVISALADRPALADAIKLGLELEELNVFSNTWNLRQRDAEDFSALSERDPGHYLSLYRSRESIQEFERIVSLLPAEFSPLVTSLQKRLDSNLYTIVLNNYGEKPIALLEFRQSPTTLMTLISLLTATHNPAKTQALQILGRILNTPQWQTVIEKGLENNDIKQALTLLKKRAIEPLSESELDEIKQDSYVASLRLIKQLNLEESISERILDSIPIEKFVHLAQRITDVDLSFCLSTYSLLDSVDDIPENSKHSLRYKFNARIKQAIIPTIKGEPDEKSQEAIKALKRISKEIITLQRRAKNPNQIALANASIEMLVSSDFFVMLSQEKNPNRENEYFALISILSHVDNEQGRDQLFNVFFNSHAFAYRLFQIPQLSQWVSRLEKSYGNPFLLAKALVLAKAGQLTPERVTQLPAKLGDLFSNEKVRALMFEYPQLFLETDEGISIYRQAINLYGEDHMYSLSHVVSYIYRQPNLQHLLFDIPTLAPELIKKSEYIGFFILNSGVFQLTNENLRFYNTLYAQYGNAAPAIVNGYRDCLIQGVITTDDREIVLEFLSYFRSLSPELLMRYQAAKKEGHEKEFINSLRSLAQRIMISGPEGISEEERALSYFPALISHVFANNAGNWTTDERNEVCSDRSSDIAHFHIKPVYTIDLFESTNLVLRQGEVLDEEEYDRLAKFMGKIATRSAEVNDSSPAVLNLVSEDLDMLAGRMNIVFPQNISLQEKLTYVVLSSLFSGEKKDIYQIKMALIMYDLASSEGFHQYKERASQVLALATNRRYAELSQWNEFFSDRQLETIKKLLGENSSTPLIQSLLPSFFAQSHRIQVQQQRQQILSKSRADRLGFSPSFIKTMKASLKQRTGKNYSDTQVRRILELYESVLKKQTGGNQPNPRNQAIRGPLEKQRQATMTLIAQLTGREISPASFSLGQLNLEQLIEEQEQIVLGQYSESTFRNYVIQQAYNLFEDERSFTERELQKFISENGSTRKRLHAYVTKNKASAHARMVGGVCVCGDNPHTHRRQTNEPATNLWDMPNYFQLVLQEPDTYRCQGLVLLHHFTRSDGKKVLTASFNPSETYLRGTDEKAMFNALLKILEDFATENNIDIIASSQNKTIRTNRTGGLFETAMNERIQAVGQEFRFETPQQFSFSPDYKLDAMDILWTKPS